MSKLKKGTGVLVAALMAVSIALGVWFVLPSGNKTTTANAVETIYAVSENGNVTVQDGVADSTLTVKFRDVFEVDSNGYITKFAEVRYRDEYLHVEIPASVNGIRCQPRQSPYIAGSHILTLTFAPRTTNFVFEEVSGDAKDGCFNGCGWMYKVVLPQNRVTKIPKYCFNYCGRLQDFVLAEGVTTLGAKAIGSYALTHITLPSTLQKSNCASGSIANAIHLVDIENRSPSFTSAADVINIITGSADNNSAGAKISNYPFTVWGVNFTYGQPHILRTKDGYVFAKNTRRSAYLATSAVAVNSVKYEMNKWYLVAYYGPESGDGLNIDGNRTNRVLTLPSTIPLAQNSPERAEYDYVDSTGTYQKIDYSSDLNVNEKVPGKRDELNKYSINQYAWFYAHANHVRIPDNTVEAIGNNAFDRVGNMTFVIGEGVTHIGTHALDDDSVGSRDRIIYLPSYDTFQNMHCGSNFIMSHSHQRLFVYKNLSDLQRRNKNGTATDSLWYNIAPTNTGVSYATYSYLMNVNAVITDTAGNKTITPIERLHASLKSNTGGSSVITGTTGSGTVATYGYRYYRTDYDAWEEDTTIALPQVEGYSSVNWYAGSTVDREDTQPSYTTRYSLSDLSGFINNTTTLYADVYIYALKVLKPTDSTYTHVYDAQAHDAAYFVTTDAVDTSIRSHVTSKLYAANGTTGLTDIRNVGTYQLKLLCDTKYGTWDSGAATVAVEITKRPVELTDTANLRFDLTSGSLQDATIYAYLEQVQGSVYQQFVPYLVEQQDKGTASPLYTGGKWAYTRYKEGVTATVEASNIPTLDGKEAMYAVRYEQNQTATNVGTYGLIAVLTPTGGNYELQINGAPATSAATAVGFEDRGLTACMDTNDINNVRITKYWYIVESPNFISLEDKGDDSSGYQLTQRNWTFADTRVSTYVPMPYAAHGSRDIMSFKLDYTPMGATAAVTVTKQNVATQAEGDNDALSYVPLLGNFSRYINSSMPAGAYTVTYKVDGHTEENGTTYSDLVQSYSFTIAEAPVNTLTYAGGNYIDEINTALQNQVFEYKYDAKPHLYKPEFDARTAFGILNKPEIAFPNRGTSVETNAWASAEFADYFQSFKISYNLLNQQNMAYSTADMMSNIPTNVGTYTIYYQIEASNYQKLTNITGDARRAYVFYVVIYDEVSLPTVNEVSYSGSSVQPDLGLGATGNYSVLWGEGNTWYADAGEAAQHFGYVNVQKNGATAHYYAKVQLYNSLLYRWPTTIGTVANTVSATRADEREELLASGANAPGITCYDSVIFEFVIKPADNVSTITPNSFGWVWGAYSSETTGIVWSTRFGSQADYQFTIKQIKTVLSEDEEGNTVSTTVEGEEITPEDFATAPAGDYRIIANLKADDNGNWNALTAYGTLRILQATNSWATTPQIVGWTWADMQAADYTLSDATAYYNADGSFVYGAAQPVTVSAKPTYSNDVILADGTAGVSFNVYFFQYGENNVEIPVCYEGEKYEFELGYDATSGSYTKLPLIVLKKLAELDAGTYYMVAVVDETENHSGLNVANKLGYSPVPFRIDSATNTWTKTPNVYNFAYGQFDNGKDISAAAARFGTAVKYSVYNAYSTVAGAANTPVNTTLTAFTLTTSDNFAQTVVDELNKLDVLASGNYYLRVQVAASAKQYGALDTVIPFSVVKAEKTISATLANWVYGGTTYTLVPNGFATTESATYTVSGNELPFGTETTGTAVSVTKNSIAALNTYLAGLNAGNYSIAITLATSRNYLAANCNLTFSVTRAPNTWQTNPYISVDGAKTTAWDYKNADYSTYASIVSGTPQHTETERGTASYAYYNAVQQNGGYVRGATNLGNTITGNAGAYFLVVSYTGLKNYENIPDYEIFFQIGRATNTWTTEPSIGDWPYNTTAGTAQAADSFGNTVANNGVSVAYYAYNKQTATRGEQLSGKPQDAGDYVMVVGVAGNGNYTALSKDVPFSISAAQFSLLTGNINGSWTWTDNETTLQTRIGFVAPTLSDNSIGATITVTIDNDSQQSYAYPTQSTALSAALAALSVGSHTLTIDAAVPGSQNYELSNPFSKTFTVAPAVNNWSVGGDVTEQNKTNASIAITKSWNWKDKDTANAAWVLPQSAFGSVVVTINGAQVVADADKTLQETIRARLATLGATGTQLTHAMVISVPAHASGYYNGLTITYTIRIAQATNDWATGKAPAAVKTSAGSTTLAYGDTLVWSIPEALFGNDNLRIEIDGTLVATDANSIAQALNNLGVGSHTILVRVDATPNYTGKSQSITFVIDRMTNGWATTDAQGNLFTGSITGWTWGEITTAEGVQGKMTLPSALHGNVQYRVTAGGTTYTTAADIAKLGAGTYTCEFYVTASESYGGIAVTKQFDIAEAVNEWTTEPTFTVNGQNASSWTYGQFAATTAVSQYGSDSIVIEYYEKGGVKLTQMPGDAGEYYMVVTMPESAGYYHAPTGNKTTQVNFTILKKEYKDWNTMPDAVGWTYGSFDVAVNIFSGAPASGGNVSFSVRNAADAVVNGLENLVYVFGAADAGGNHSRNLVLAADAGAGALHNTTVTDLLRALTAGSYKLRVHVDETTNYQSFSSDVLFSVELAQNEWKIVPNIAGWAYGEAAKLPQAVPAYGVARITIKSADGNTTYYEGSYNAETKVSTHTKNILDKAEAGQYRLYALVDAVSGKYTGLQEQVIEFVIIPSSIQIRNYWLPGFLPFIADWTALEQPSTPVGDSLRGQTQYAFYTVKTEDGKLVLDEDGKPVKDKLLSEAPGEPGQYIMLMWADYYVDGVCVASDHLETEVPFQVYMRQNHWKTPPAIKDWFLSDAASVPTAECTEANTEITYLYKLRNMADNTAVAERPTTAGEYTLVVRAQALYCEDLVEYLDFTVSLSVNSWEIIPTIADWSEEFAPNAPEGKAAFGEIVYTYYERVGDELRELSAIPTTEGKYLMRATVELEGYETLVGEAEFSITAPFDMTFLIIDIALGVAASAIAVVVIVFAVRRKKQC